MSINLTLGCMFSGKTSALLNAAKLNKLIGKNVLLINFIEDSRYSSSDKITTHDKVSIDCKTCGEDIMDVFKYYNKEYSESHVICINEGQFFKNLVSFCLMACTQNKEIHVCGLDGDYLKRPFGEILTLIPHCENVTKLKAICMMCKTGKKASFTKRIADSDQLVVIGSTETYMPVCRQCYNNII
jgi:thymidine kinase